MARPRKRQLYRAPGSSIAHPSGEPTGHSPRPPQEERSDREKQLQRANKEILYSLSEHVKQFEVEKLMRLQRETQTLKRVGDEVFRIQQKIGSERARRMGHTEGRLGGDFSLLP